jgi:hypothetical protein
MRCLQNKSNQFYYRGVLWERVDCSQLFPICLIKDTYMYFSTDHEFRLKDFKRHYKLTKVNNYTNNIKSIHINNCLKIYVYIFACLHENLKINCIPENYIDSFNSYLSRYPWRYNNEFLILMSEINLQAIRSWRSNQLWYTYNKK